MEEEVQVEDVPAPAHGRALMVPNRVGFNWTNSSGASYRGKGALALELYRGRARVITI